MEKVIYYGIVCLFLCLSKSLVAFQTDYNSIDSSIDETLDPDQYDERFLLNAPYSYCKEDGIPLSLCTDLGLNLFGNTFQNLNILDNFNAEHRYDVKTRTTWYEELIGIENMYYLPSYRYKNYQIPTEGQLVWMFNNGYATRGSKTTKHWVRMSETNALTLAIVEEGYKTPNRLDSGKLHRLVTDNIPSACSGFDCKDFRAKLPTLVVIRNSANLCTILGWGYNVSWVQGSMTMTYNASRLSNSRRVEFQIPHDARNVNIHMYAGSSAWSRRNRVEVTDFPSITKTINIGSTIYQNICYYMKGNCVNYTVTPYYECW